MAHQPTSEARTATLFCPEDLRPLACLVVDALNARGFDVRLVSGPNARASLRRSVRGPSFGLRVVCVSRRLHADELVQMRRVLDPYLRGDLLIVPLLTPHEVIDQIVRFGQPPRPIVPRMRATRSYLLHPTLVESKVEPRRWVGYGLAGAAATAAACGVFYLGAHPQHLQVAERSAPTVTQSAEPAAARSPSPLIDTAVHSAVAQPPVDDLEWIEIIDDEAPAIDYPEPRLSADPVAVRPRRPRATEDSYDEEIIIIEDDEPAREQMALDRTEEDAATDRVFDEFESMLQETQDARPAPATLEVDTSGDALEPRTERRPPPPPDPEQATAPTVTYDPFADPRSVIGTIH